MAAIINMGGVYVVSVGVSRTLPVWSRDWAVKRCVQAVLGCCPSVEVAEEHTEDEIVAAEARYWDWMMDWDELELAAGVPLSTQSPHYQMLCAKRDASARHVRVAMDRGEEIRGLKPLRSDFVITRVQIEELRDWLAALPEQDPLMMGKLDRLTLGQAVEHARVWHEAMLRRKEKLADSGSETVYQYEDGWRFVQLKTREALDYEGSRMHHCVGDGGYDDDLGGDLAVYSLRDADNKPWATLAVTYGTYAQQLYGPCNQQPDPRTHDMLADSLNRMSLTLVADYVAAQIEHLTWHGHLFRVGLEPPGYAEAMKRVEEERKKQAEMMKARGYHEVMGDIVDPRVFDIFNEADVFRRPRRDFDDIQRDFDLPPDVPPVQLALARAVQVEPVFLARAPPPAPEFELGVSMVLRPEPGGLLVPSWQDVVHVTMSRCDA